MSGAVCGASEACAHDLRRRLSPWSIGWWLAPGARCERELQRSRAHRSVNQSISRGNQGCGAPTPSPSAPRALSGESLGAINGSGATSHADARRLDTSEALIDRTDVKCGPQAPREACAWPAPALEHTGHGACATSQVRVPAFPGGRLVNRWGDLTVRAVGGTPRTAASEASARCLNARPPASRCRGDQRPRRHSWYTGWPRPTRRKALRHSTASRHRVLRRRSVRSGSPARKTAAGMVKHPGLKARGLREKSR